MALQALFADTVVIVYSIHAPKTYELIVHDADIVDLADMAITLDGPQAILGGKQPG